MSGEKINTSDLANALADRAAITKKNAEVFVDTLQEVFQQALLNDKLVKISGLGTFRLQWVEPRRSVNVQDGSPIEITGRYKVVFTPETSLKNRVNEPFAHLEATAMPGKPINRPEVEKDVPLQKLASQAVEIQSILSTINDPELSEEPVKEPVVEVELESEVVKYETLETETSASEHRYTPVATIEESKPMFETISQNASMVSEHKKRKLTWLWVTLLVLLLFGGGFAVYYFYGKWIQESVMTLVEEWQADKEFEEQVELAGPVEEMPKPTTEVQVKEASIFDQPREYKEFIADVRVPNGGRLTLISQKYYGHKDFWVYIYEANKDKFTHPDRITVGTVVRIPKLNPELINSKNPETLVYARKLHDKYVGTK